MSTAPPAQFNDDASRWRAVCQRDVSADGQFVYAVTTTGIYCQPSCPSRRAKRRNVRFFDNGAMAEAAGFRRCRRCGHQRSNADVRQRRIVEHACQQLASAAERPTLEQLAAAAGMSRYQFHRLFRQATGITPMAYARACRAQRLRQGLQQATAVTGAIYDAGYQASSRFYDEAVSRLGMHPAEYRRGGAQQRIRFAVVECSLGLVLIAATAKGLCAIEFGDQSECLLERLEARFPQAELIGGDTEFDNWVTQITSHIESPAGSLELPLDIRGTAFQHLVWTALREIPPGTTLNYAAVARIIGRPGAARAVAGACAANQLAIAIPCHRVVPANGGVGGYRWGTSRKQRLLQREAQTADSDNQS